MLALTAATSPTPPRNAPEANATDRPRLLKAPLPAIAPPADTADRALNCLAERVERSNARSSLRLSPTISTCNVRAIITPLRRIRANRSTQREELRRGHVTDVVGAGLRRIRGGDPRVVGGLGRTSPNSSSNRPQRSPRSRSSFGPGGPASSSSASSASVPRSSVIAEPNGASASFSNTAGTSRHRCGRRGASRSPRGRRPARGRRTTRRRAPTAGSRTCRLIQPHSRVVSSPAKSSS